MRCSEQWEWRKRAERRASVEESLSANDRSLWLLLLLLLSFWLCPSLFANQTLQITRFENITPKIYLSCRDGAIPDRDTNFGPFFALSLFLHCRQPGIVFITILLFGSSFLPPSLSLSFSFCPVLCFVSVGRLQFFSFTFFLPTSSLRLIPLHFGQWLGKSCSREKLVKSW